MKTYVGNFFYEVTEHELRQEFDTFAEVTSLNVTKDGYSGCSRGFRFIEMASGSQDRAALAGLNVNTLKHRMLNVNAARPASDNRDGGYYGKGEGGWLGIIQLWRLAN